MAKAPAKKKKKAGSSRGGATRSIVFILVLSLALIYLLNHTFIFLVAGMLPGIVAYVIDRSPGRRIFQIVALSNLAGVFPYVAQLMQQGNTATAVQGMLSTPSVWMFMYLAAGFGWVLVWIAPTLAQQLLELTNNQKIARLQRLQKRLEEEWGPEVRRGTAEASITKS
jgi:hypothetical protein